MVLRALRVRRLSGSLLALCALACSGSGNGNGNDGGAGGAVNASGASGIVGSSGASGSVGALGGAFSAGAARASAAGVSGASTGNGGAGGTNPNSGGASGSAGASGAGGTGGVADGPCGAKNPAVVPLPVIPDRTFRVTDYGALGDDKTDDTSALQAALSAAGSAGGGTVVVPAGTYLSGPIVLSSGTRLELSAGAMLKMLPMASYGTVTAFITANNAHDIALTGSGTIEGQGQDWWNALTATPDLKRPQQVSFSNSTRVLIHGVRFQNSPEEHIWVKGDTDVTVTGITISTLAVQGQHIPNNTDGVDIGATGVFFCGNDIACGDDNVVMSGSKIYVAYSKFGVGHGCSIGSITQKGVSDVTVDHVDFDGTTSGIRMKSARDRGGLVQNLSYTNLTLKNVQNPVYITSYYPSLPADPKSDPAQAVSATTPVWKNITIKNVTVTGSANAGILWGLPESKIEMLTFDNVQIQAKTGMEIFHASGVSFVNGSSVTPASGAAVTTYDAAVTGITTTAY
jgi:polygalacturonase